jgi:pimeloyl-ACP methyl ester carboxylesterase
VPLVRACAEAIPGARLITLPGVGHIPSIEQPEQLARAMHAFFKEAGHD